MYRLILFMCPHMLERIHLAIIREVHLQGSLTAAADKLCLTQSALSHAIKKVEQQLGISVWKREGRALHLTQAGQYLLQLSNRLLPQLEHAEKLMQQYADGQRGSLRIGMECYPCYQWLLKIVSSYLAKWPSVDVDVKQKFQFGGMGALFAHEIDVLITPDPLYQKGLRFEPVFNYEQVLVVNQQHHLTQHSFIHPQQLVEETLITYPVEIERLDIFNQFLLPAGCKPKQHKIIENTDIMLQMVAADRGVTALPNWLVELYAEKIPIHAIRLGENGIQKQIFLGMREKDNEIDYIQAFIDLARASR